MKLDVLIFAAHPDDAELAMGGTIASGDYSTALGQGTKASGVKAQIEGRGLWAG